MGSSPKRFGMFVLFGGVGVGFVWMVHRWLERIFIDLEYL